MAIFESRPPKWRPTARRRQPHTYFVGRRPHEAPEVYAVTQRSVQLLRRDRHNGPLSLDWCTRDARALELSHVLLARVGGIVPPRELAEEFLFTVLAHLPEAGFVLDSDDILLWLDAGDAHETAPSQPGRRSWLARLIGAILRAGRKEGVEDV